MYTYMIDGTENAKPVHMHAGMCEVLLDKTYTICLILSVQWWNRQVDCAYTGGVLVIGTLDTVEYWRGVQD